MIPHLQRPLIAGTFLLMTAGGASAQGTTVRTWGYYDPVPYGPVFGETYSYTPYRPTVTMYDSWGRLVDMPLRPKVLYYDTPFLTPQGAYRPRSIVVMPDSRPRGYPVPAPTAPSRAQVAEPIPPATTFPYDGGPTSPVPAVEADVPAPRPPAVDRPAPKPPAADRLPMPEVPAPSAVRDDPGVKDTKNRLPVPDVPALPTIPAAPGAAQPAAPKLGPTPMDIPLTKPGR
jgi:hypothetical protein